MTPFILFISVQSHPFSFKNLNFAYALKYIYTKKCQLDSKNVSIHSGKNRMVLFATGKQRKRPIKCDAGRLCELRSFFEKSLFQPVRPQNVTTETHRCCSWQQGELKKENREKKTRLSDCTAAWREGNLNLQPCLYFSDNLFCLKATTVLSTVLHRGGRQREQAGRREGARWCSGRTKARGAGWEI